MAAAATLNSGVHDIQRAFTRGSSDKARGSRMKSLNSVEESVLSSAPGDDYDPLRILEPAQKKLSTVESQRILAVMDDTIKKLESALVLPFLSDSLSRFTVAMGTDLVALMEEYQREVCEYNRLHQQLNSQGITPKVERTHSQAVHSGRRPSAIAATLKGHLSTPTRPVRLQPLEPTPEANVEEEFYEVRHRLKRVIKSIVGTLARNPSTATMVKNAAHEKSKMGEHMVAAVTDLQAVVQEKLLTTKLEEDRRDEYLQKVVARQNSAEEEILKLEKQLAEAMQCKNEEVSQKNSEIKKLKSNIHSVIKLAQEANKRVQAEADRQDNSNKSNYEERKSKIEEQISELRKKLHDLEKANREKEQDQRKRAFKQETEVENWIREYDRDMGEKQDELEELQEEYEKEKKLLKELEEKSEILSIEYETVVKEQEAARQKAEEAEKRMNDMLRAATVIQRVWKRYRQQKQSQKDQKKGKKGKKGKGGKNKKKGKKT